MRKVLDYGDDDQKIPDWDTDICGDYIRKVFIY